jgi:hypothetical protein
MFCVSLSITQEKDGASVGMSQRVHGRPATRGEVRLTDRTPCTARRETR